jgi:TolB-like protein
VQPITSETLQARIVVEQFALLGQMPGGPNIARGLSDQLISELSKVNGLVVIEPKLSANSPAAASMFALQGSISRENNTIHVQARLMATDDGHVVWAKRFDSQTDGRDILDLQALICAQIVNDISLTRQIRSSLLTN